MVKEWRYIDRCKSLRFDWFPGGGPRKVPSHTRRHRHPIGPPFTGSQSGASSLSLSLSFFLFFDYYSSISRPPLFHGHLGSFFVWFFFVDGPRPAPTNEITAKASRSCIPRRSSLSLSLSLSLPFVFFLFGPFFFQYCSFFFVLFANQTPVSACLPPRTAIDSFGPQAEIELTNQDRRLAPRPRFAPRCANNSIDRRPSFLLLLLFLLLFFFFFFCCRFDLPRPCEPPERCVPIDRATLFFFLILSFFFGSLSIGRPIDFGRLSIVFFFIYFRSQRNRSGRQPVRPTALAITTSIGTR